MFFTLVVLYRNKLCIPDICGITETFLKDTIQDSEINIPGFNTVRLDRKGKPGGGVIAYIRHKHTFINRNDLYCNSIESVWLEMKPSNQRPYLVCIIYRPPDAHVEWYVHFETQLEKASATNLEIILMGDLNIDLMKHYNGRWEILIQTFNLTQVVDVPTRVTENTSTLIDHFYVTNPELVTQVTVPPIGLSDHYSISMLYGKGMIAKRSKHKTIETRNTKNFNSDLFCDDLSSISVKSHCFADANEHLESFNGIFL